MDNKKDIQKTENISRFVDKNTIRTQAFGDNKMGEKAYRRAERIVAAIHLLTNHIDPHEPIRNTVRTHAPLLLESLLSIRDEMRTVGSTKTHAIESQIRLLISLLRIIAISGFVSFENADILTDALDELGSFVESSRLSVLSDNIRLSREDLLNVPNIAINKGDNIKDIDSIRDRIDVLNTVQYKKDNKATINNTLRTQGILEVLRNGGNMGIRDIAINLPEYSEKMIQRELTDLILKGHVIKTGLKRWSTYTIVVTNSTP